MNTTDLFGVNDLAWMDHGKCAGRPDQDTPQSRRAYGLEVDLNWHPDGEQAEARTAQTACNGCQVLNKCLTYALEHPEEEGIWGGTSHAQRVELRRGAVA